MLTKAFSKAAQNTGTGANTLIDAVKAERPDLAGETAVYYPEQGSSAYTIIIGDEVFKGPIEAGQIFTFDQEYKTLKHLEGKGLPVPQVTCVGKESYFYGMTKVEGVPLGSVDLDKMPSESQDQVARDIVSFMLGLAQAITPEDAEAIGIDKPLSVDRYVKPKDIRDVLGSSGVKNLLGTDFGFCEGVIAGYEKMLEKKHMVFTHDDLHGGNVIYDPVAKKVSGFIDFGFCSYAIPETWVVGFPSGYSKGFSQRIREEYLKQVPDETTRNNVQVYRCISALALMRGALPSYSKTVTDSLKEISAARAVLEGKTSAEPAPPSTKKGSWFKAWG